MVYRAPTYLDKTRLVEEVPGLDYRCYIWHQHRVVWRGMTKQDGEAWAAEHDINIEEFEPFEP